ncbi:hypothetical protein [Papillibacter cinnamivorans]|uniref:Uncharacterized protein n=1 Tax=Papillibacter cinnamivorans DSM 12816 TaxID=1122930 RepID=A0A1W2C6H1_9FIRM|nr:hypothetical protein [Papillibacter cinnamivorans]SMC80472.1 hypothetical protein SAMN02745168_2575 [Papillibacter cinnamivorans DSM 12816]
MAVIQAQEGALVRIDRFLGLNESPDGDTGLKPGEASVMRNFRVTREGNLQLRPGYKTVCTLSEGNPVRGLWQGFVNGTERLVAACGGQLWEIDCGTFEKTDLGILDDAPVFFFGFSEKLYIQNGSQYKVWDGETLEDVAGYVPVVLVSSDPAGGGTTLQQVNKLTGSKWQWFSSTSGSTVYHLAETGIDSVDEVRVDDEERTSGYSADLEAGTVTFSAAPGAGTNDVKIRWTKGTGDRETVLAQKFAETYNGSADTRVFLYGDGTNKAYYSGIEYETGLPTAEYFPDLNVLDVGDGNTALTSLVRHFNKLLAQKKGGGSYLVDFDFITLADGTQTAAFYTRAIDRDMGNDVPGGVRLVYNYPVSLQGNAAYRWGLIYTSGVQDERSAKRISDPVRRTMGELDLAAAVTFDDENSREYWIVSGDTALIWNYSGETDSGGYKNNLWYVYTGIPALCFAPSGQDLLFGSGSGALMRLSRDYRNDDGEEIDAKWESGSMDFGSDWMRKYTDELFLVMKPESGARITVGVQTERKSAYPEKTVSSGLASYVSADYAHWAYGTNRKPRTRRLKLMARKFTFCKLIFKSVSVSATNTVLACSLRAHRVGKVR